ncbi:hypothetical protein GCM10028777_08230 [Angustibacter speluncae]
MSHDRDDDVRALLARAVPDVTPPPDVDADLVRGRAALGRRRSVLATLAVGAGTVLLAAGAVALPERLAPTGAAPAAPTATGLPLPTTEGDDRSTGADVARLDEPAGDPVPLEPSAQDQHPDDVVATVVPRGWSVTSADASTLRVTDGTPDGVVDVVPSPFPGTPPVMRGVGDFERLGGTHVSYYWVDESSGTPRPSMVFELTYGRWAQVSATPRLGWGMAELGAFASGLRAPFTCAEPCEVPLVP